MRALQVAIDGPAGAGKSTVARLLARRLGYVYIDTGAMYRAVALLALEAGSNGENEEELVAIARANPITFQPDPHSGPPRVMLGDRDITSDIRRPEVTALASKVAEHARVREWLVERQRELARDGGVVMDGRDIGTVVLPDADVKIFLTASLDERARRRRAELERDGYQVSFSRLKDEIARRDLLDANRDVSPLRRAPDAVLVDTTGRPVAEIVEEIYSLCAARQRCKT